MSKTKILFTHNTAMWYRIPFFRKIAEKYDLDLVFTHYNVISEIYNKDTKEEIKQLESVNYTILKNTHGFARGLIKKALTDTDVVIGGSWDTPQELIETIILQTITRIRRKPFIIWREDWDWKKQNTPKEKILNKIIKYITKKANLILVPGTIHEKYFKKLTDNKTKIQIMPNVSNITHENTQINLNLTTDKKTVLYVGRLIKRKGVIYLLEAFRKLDKKNTQLVIIGEGDEEENLKQYTKDNKMENVTFTGKIENNKLKEFYREANVVVIPSTDDIMGDPWVFVLNEAMEYNNPVIATNAVGASYDMIDENGYIIDQRNPDELYKAINKILTDEKLEKKMSLKSREIIDKKYQYKNMTDAFDKAIEYVTK